MSFVADWVYDMVSSTAPVTINSTGGSLELNLAKQRLNGIISCAISSPSSLVGGFLKLQGYDELSQNWIGIPQEVYLLATNSGTPAVISGNAASTTAIAGGSAKNTTGITNITDVTTVIFTFASLGKMIRLAYGCSSGTASLTLDSRGLFAI